MEILVQFPDGFRLVPAFEHPDNDMYAGMPGEMVKAPLPIEGWVCSLKDGIGPWVATPAPQKPARIFDNPNDPHYGPVRRLWIIFAGLDLLGVDAEYRHEWGMDWDDAFTRLIDFGWSETRAARRITYHAINARKAS